MKKIVVGVTLFIGVALTTICLADEIRIPLSIKEKMFIEEMKRRGMDLSHTDESDGHTAYTSDGFCVYTYRPVTKEQLVQIQEAAFKCVRK